MPRGGNRGNDYFGDSQDALRMMIPLVINERNIKSDAERWDKRLDQLRQQAEAETLQKLEEHKRAKEEAEKKFVTDTFLKAAEKGIDPLVQSFGPKFEKATGTQLPKHFSSPEGIYRYHGFQKPPEKENLPNTPDALLARAWHREGLSADEIQKRILGMKSSEEASKAQHRPRTAEEKLPPEVSAAINLLKTYKETGNMNPMNALIASMPGVNPQVAQLLTQQGQTNPEMKQALDNARQIVDSYFSGKGGKAPVAPVMGDDPLGLRKK